MVNEDLNSLQKMHAGLKERLASVTPPERLRRLEIFLPDYVEAIQEVKRKFTPKSLSQDLIHEVESIGRTVLHEINFYYKEVNKNHTVKMGEVLSQLNIMVNGLALSDGFKNELESQHQSNSWHGH